MSFFAYFMVCFAGSLELSVIHSAKALGETEELGPFDV